MFWTILQYIGLITSFLYLWLEFHQKPVMWVVSAMCSAIYASIYCHAKIYGDMSFSIFNICMCAYGFWKWAEKKRQMTTIPLATEEETAYGPSTDNNPKKPGAKQIIYRHFRWTEFGIVTLITAAIWLTIFLLLKYLTDSPVPALDSLTTTLNIVGTWVLAQKIIEVWGYWFIVNLVSIYLYCKRGLHLTTILLYGFYLCASVYGWWKWKHYGHLASAENNTPHQLAD